MARIVLLLLAVGVATPFAQAPVPLFELPTPTGMSPIGTTRWVVTDTSRDETFASGRKRDIEIIAWAAGPATGQTAFYLRNGVDEVLSFARLARLGDSLNGLAAVKTHATIDAAPAASPARFPVIVFQHGYTGLPSSYTTLLEDLASHGWVVLNVIHPYEATAARLADGTIVTHTDHENALCAPIMAVLNEWGAEDDTMAKVASASSDADKEQLMRGYLGTLKHSVEVVTRWTLDVEYVLDHLPKTGAAARIASRLDLSRLGVAGHSMGGVAGAQFCVEDRRCKAALNLDGIPQYGPMIDSTMPAPFLMVYSARPGRAGASDIIYRRAASKYYRVDVKDTLHIDFSDMNYWAPLRQRGASGKMPAARASEITRMVVREFFGQEILKQPSAFLRGKQSLADVTVVEVKK